MNPTPIIAQQSLDTLIRTALRMAVDVGRPEIIPGLEAALSANGDRVLELDILAAEVRRGGHAIRLSRGEKALLIALALQRRPCTRAELCELLYPHLDEAIASIQLKVYVHRVRRRLGDPKAILFASNAYRLADNFVVDFWQIQALVAQGTRVEQSLTEETRARLSTIRSRLVRRDISWNGNYEWGYALERRLEALLFDVTVRLGEAELADNNLAAALRLATEVCHLDPCDERGVKLAMRAYFSVGDRDAANRLLRRYERTLKEEFDCRPSSDLMSFVASFN